MTAQLERSEFDVPKMDCPSEESTIRLALDGVRGVVKLDFDIPARRLEVWHQAGSGPSVSKRLKPLGFGARLIHTSAVSLDQQDIDDRIAPVQSAVEKKTLSLLLAINAFMFVIEFVAGLLAESSGLLADSLDMLADAGVYGLSFYAVGRSRAHKVFATRVSGWLQALLAAGAIIEVGRRAIWGSEPQPEWMMGIALLALIANAACLMLVYPHRDGEMHMKASYIFSANDVIANGGVLLAGAMVAVTGSHLPDLVVGLAIGSLVLSGAIRILKLAKASG